MVTHPIRIDTAPCDFPRTEEIVARVATAVSPEHGANPPSASGLWESGRRAYVLLVEGNDNDAQQALARATAAAADDATVRYDGPWTGALPARLEDQ